MDFNFTFNLKFMLIALVCLSVNNTFSQSKNGNVSQVEVEIDLDNINSKIVVQSTYELNTKGSQEVPLKGLLFGNKSVKLIQASVNGENRTLEIAERNGLLKAVLPISAYSDSVLTFSLTYEVGLEDNSEKLDLTIPILYIDWPSLSKEDVFTATLHLSKTHLIRESFPATNWKVNEQNSYITEIPGVPSMLRVIVVKKQNAGMGFSSVIDLSIAVVLIILLVLGWRKIKLAI